MNIEHGTSLVFYKTEKGQSPVTEFLDSLPSKVAQKVAWVLKLIQELDTVPIQYLKKLTATDEIWECRMVFRRQHLSYSVLLSWWQSPDFDTRLHEEDSQDTI